MLVSGYAKGLPCFPFRERTPCTRSRKHTVKVICIRRLLRIAHSDVRFSQRHEKKVTSCQDDSNSRPAPQSRTRSSLEIWIPRCAGICQCCRLGTSIVTVPFTLSGAQVTWDTTFSWAGLAQSFAGRLATSPIQIRFLPALER